MKVRPYARRRGVDHKTVLEAIEAERLKESVGWTENGTPFIRDPDLADREWAARTNAAVIPDAYKPGAREQDDEAPPPDGPVDFHSANAREKHWKAQLAELKFKETAKELTSAAELEAQLVGEFSRCKTKLLGIPSRARQQLPHLTVGDLAVLEDLIREALEELTHD